MPFSLTTQRKITPSITEAEYVSLLAYAQEVNFSKLLLEEIPEVHKPEIIHEDNQGAIFLKNIRQDGMHTKHIDIFHHFLRYITEEKDMDTDYIRSE